MADDIKLRVHGAKDGKVNPVVVSFVQGPPAEGCLTGDDNTGPFRPITFRLSGSSDSRRKSHRQLAGANDTLRLEARNHGEGVVRDAAKYMVGVLHGKRKRLELYPLEGDAVLALGLTAVTAPGAAGASSSGISAKSAAAAAAAAAASGGLDGLDMRARRDMVIADFGSKKKQAMERSRKANIVDVTAVAAAGDVAGALKTDAASAKPAEGGAGSGSGTSAAKIDEALMQARLATLPPFDAAATLPSKAYPLHRILVGPIFRGVAAAANRLLREVREADAATEPSEEDRQAAAAAASAAATAAGADAAAAEAAGAAAAAAVKARTAEDVINRSSRDSEFVRQRLIALLPGIRAEAAAEAAADAAEKAAEAAEAEEAAGDEEDAAAAESRAAAALGTGSADAEGAGRDGAGDDGAAPAAPAAKRRRPGAKERAAAEAAGVVPIFRRLCALIYLRHLIVLSRAPTELRYRRLPVGQKPGKPGAEAAAADAAAPTEEGGEGETRVVVPQLKFMRDDLVTAMLASFAEARPDPRAAAAAAGGSAEAEGVPPYVYVRTPPLCDRLTAYACVLALAADEYSTDLRLLARDLRVVPARLAGSFRELGCSLKAVREGDAGGAGGADMDEEDDAGAGAGKKAGKAGKSSGPVVSYVCTLKVPLVFPALKLGRGK